MAEGGELQTVACSFWTSSNTSKVSTFNLSSNVTEASLCDSIGFSQCEGILFVFTLDNVEVPDWLLLVFKSFCQLKKCTVVCNTTVIREVSSSDSGGSGDGVFKLDTRVFVRAYCSAPVPKSIAELSKLHTIRSPPELDCQALPYLQSSLVAGWRLDQFVICSSDEQTVLDGATRVFIYHKLGTMPNLPNQLPCVYVLPNTPIWILNEILALLSQAGERREWTPGDTLNLASFQIQALESKPERESAVRRMRQEKIFKPLPSLIDLALAAESREICSDLSKNVVMNAKGSLVFYQNLSIEKAVEYCKKIRAACGHVGLGDQVQEKVSEFCHLVQRQSIKKGNEFASLSAICNKLFTQNMHASLDFGIQVTRGTSSGPVISKLKWNSQLMRHVSATIYICGVPQHNLFECRSSNGTLFATKSVTNLVESLGCFQGTAHWCCFGGCTSFEVSQLSQHFEVAEDSECSSSSESDPAKPTPNPRPRPKPKSAPPPPAKKHRTVTVTPISTSKFPFIEMHRLWSSLQSVEYDFQTLWQYLQYPDPDVDSFVSKIERHLCQLLQYHADLYSDTRFTALAPSLIGSASKIQKGAKLSTEQLRTLKEHIQRYGWLVTPVLWTRAELLLLLTAVFHPRLLFTHVIQQKEGMSSENYQNRGMALTSPFLSNILFERLRAFELLGDKHEAGDAVVLDSNGSFMQHHAAHQNRHFFKPMSPLTVVEVSGAPNALSCNGSYTQVGKCLYVQNVDESMNEFAPQARIIEFDGKRWRFKHRLAQGVDFSLLFEEKENDNLVGERDWHAFCGTDDGRVYKKVSVNIVNLKEPERFEFGFGMHGHTVHLERNKPKPVLLSQKLHTDGQVDYDPKEFDIHGRIVLDTNPFRDSHELRASEGRAAQQRLSGTSFLPQHTPNISAFDGPLGALFCLMFGTCLGFIDLTMDIPIGACLLFSFVFPHKGAMYDYINRRLHLYILNKKLSRIPAGTVEQRLRVLACAQQRLESRGPTDYFDITLLDNLTTHEILVGVPDAIRPFCEDPINIVYGEGWMYAGDINLNGQPNGFGCKIHSSDAFQKGYFKNGVYISNSSDSDGCIQAARHVNTLFKSLQSMTSSCSVEAEQVCQSAALELQRGLYQHVDEVEFQGILNLLSTVKVLHSARFKAQLQQCLQDCCDAKAAKAQSTEAIDSSSVSHAISSAVVDDDVASAYWGDDGMQSQDTDQDTPAHPVGAAAAAMDPNESKVADERDNAQSSKLVIVLSSSEVASGEDSSSDDDGGAGTVHVGFNNPRYNCCYHSLLQILFHIGSFRKAVFQSSSDINSNLQIGIVGHLQRIFCKLQTSVNCVKEFCYIEDFAQLLSFSTAERQDAYEIWNRLVDMLDEASKKTLPQCFRCTWSVRIECSDHAIVRDSSSESALCLEISLDYALEQIVPGVVPDEPSILSKLRQFILPAYMTGENQYKVSENPDVFADATKTNHSVSLPPVLILMIKRFQPGVATTKNVSFCSFPEILDLSDIGSETAQSSAAVVYQLQSVLVHTEKSRGSGHYYSFIRVGESWLCFNDSAVTAASSSDAIDSNFGGKIYRNALVKSQPTAYMLVYVRQSQLDDICNNSVHIPKKIKNTVKAEDARREQAAAEAEISSRTFTPNTPQPLPPLPQKPKFTFTPQFQLSGVLACVTQEDVTNQFALKNEYLAQWTERTDLILPLDAKFTPQESLSGSSYCSAMSRCPHITKSHEYISEEPVDWFFMALTGFFPRFMHIPVNMLLFKGPRVDEQKLAIWRKHFISRRPEGVLVPVSLPKDMSRPQTGDNIGYHYVLLTMATVWNKHTLTAVTVNVLDPFNNSKFIDPTKMWFKDVVKYLLPPNYNLSLVQYAERDPSLTKLQSGYGNVHCAVYAMALGINFVMGTLNDMSILVGPNPADTCSVGLELRKLVALDCIHDPPLLDACLFMCPKFCKKPKPVTPQLSKWWRLTPHHNLIVSLSIELPGGKFSMLSKDPNDRLKPRLFWNSFYPVASGVPTDGPFFFENSTTFVKVYSIGLLDCFEKDPVSVNRAARAFQDATFTTFVCGKKGWWCQTFGLVCCGLSTPYVFVCIARHKLSRHALTDSEVGNFSLNFTKTAGVLHGDVHRGNIGVNAKNEVECVDLERGIFIDVNGLLPPLVFHQLYASSVTDRKNTDILMNKIKETGLDRTRQHFIDLYVNGQFLTQFDPTSEASILCSRSLGCWKYDPLFHLLQLLSDADVTLEFESKDATEYIVCHNRPFKPAVFLATCRIAFQRAGFFGSIRILSAQIDSSLNGTVKEVFGDLVLNGEDRTIFFFRDLLQLFKPSESLSMQTSEVECEPQPKRRAAVAMARVSTAAETPSTHAVKASDKATKVNSAAAPSLKVSAKATSGRSAPSSSSPAYHWKVGHNVLYVTASSYEHTVRGVVDKVSLTGDAVAYNIVLSSGSRVVAVKHSDVFRLVDLESNWPPKCFKLGTNVFGKDCVRHGSSSPDTSQVVSGNGTVVSVAVDINSEPAYYALRMDHLTTEFTEYWVKSSDIDVPAASAIVAALDSSSDTNFSTDKNRRLVEAALGKLVNLQHDANAANDFLDLFDDGTVFCNAEHAQTNAEGSTAAVFEGLVTILLGNQSNLVLRTLRALKNLAHDHATNQVHASIAISPLVGIVRKGGYIMADDTQLLAVETIEMLCKLQSNIDVLSQILSADAPSIDKFPRLRDIARPLSTPDVNSISGDFQLPRCDDAIINPSSAAAAALPLPQVNTAIASPQESSTILDCLRIASSYDPFEHLMKLLHEAAATNNDTSPRLSSAKTIECRIRPHLDPNMKGDKVVCIHLDFNILENGSMLVSSVTLPHCLSSSQYTLFMINFEQGLTKGAFHTLTTPQETANFFNTSLCISESRGDAADYYSSGTDFGSDSHASSDTSAKRKRPVKAQKTPQKTLSQFIMNAMTSFKHNAPNVEVYNTVWASIRKRFPDDSAPLRCPAFVGQPSKEPENALEPRHFRCDYSCVTDSTSQDRCIQFITSQNELTIDTETAHPSLPGTAPVALVQIGTTRCVYLIQVSAIVNSVQFFQRLNATLSHKMLVHWGGDDDAKLQALIGRLPNTTFQNLQQDFRKGKQLRGLDTCVEEFFQQRYTLSKTWTLAGWDCPLKEGQKRYAACDVIGCHALFLSKKKPEQLVFSCDPAGFQSFLAPQRAVMVQHGFSCSMERIGHFEEGVFLRGLCLKDNNMSFTGFSTASEEPAWFQKPQSVDVEAFLKILNSELFCCRMCSRLKWFKIVGFVPPSINVLRPIPPNLSHRVYTIKKTPKTSSVTREFQFRDGVPMVNAAHACITILAAFFDVEVDENPKSWDSSVLVLSVLADIYYGHIYNTLVYLKDPSS